MLFELNSYSAEEILRIIAYAKYNCTTKHLFQDLKFLPLDQILDSPSICIRNKF